MVIKDKLSKTFSTIIGEQVGGKKCLRLSVVIQKLAFVIEATLEYFLE